MSPAKDKRIELYHALKEGRLSHAQALRRVREIQTADERRRCLVALVLGFVVSTGAVVVGWYFGAR